MWKAKGFKFFFREFSEFVPKHAPIGFAEKKLFVDFLNNHKKILVLTGAGVSTESGIPDYRSEDVGMLTKKGYKPIQYNDFIKNPDVRLRYWARNYVGWPKFCSYTPNKMHFFITHLQISNTLSGIVTQNVDGLHTKSGSKDVLELHGNAFWVKCLNCKTLILRCDFQTILKETNPNWNISSDDIRPDGDVEIENEKTKEFIVPDCKECGGILKPTIVFFGENIPPKVVEKVEKLVEECDAVLVIGTSLTTLSSYRIITQAFDLNKFLCFINIGESRGDKFADLIFRCKCSDIIPHVLKENRFNFPFYY